jgi:tetratricopeptide (TPR) repeat protein
MITWWQVDFEPLVQKSKMLVNQFLTLVLASSVMVPMPFTFENPNDWSGKVIIPKQSGLNAFRASDDQSRDRLNRTDYVVVKDCGPILQIYHNQELCWIPRKQVLLAKDAISYFTEEIKKNPTDSGLLAKRSKAYEIVGNLDAAISDYDEAIRISQNNGNNSSWLNNRANLYLKRRQIEKAIEEYTKAIEQWSSTAIYFNNRGNAWMALGEYEKALADYEKGIQVEPNYPLIRTNLGNLLREERRYDEAVKSWNATLNIDPRASLAMTYLGYFALDRGDLSDAKNWLNQSFRLDTRSAFSFVLKGNISRREKNFVAARADYEFARWLDPNYTTAISQLAVLNAMEKRESEAISELETALKLDPVHFALRDLMAKLIVLQSNPKLRDFQKARELAQVVPKQIRLKKGNFRLTEVLILQAEGKNADAKKLFVILKQEDPEWSKLYAKPLAVIQNCLDQNQSPSFAEALDW